MSCGRLGVAVGAVFVLLMSSPTARAQSLAPVGNLDCNGYSQIQKPLKPQQACADFRGAYDERGYDNGHYIGHDEPSIGFISTAAHSGNNVQWEFTLPRERPLPATQSFENFAAFWLSMALCDPQSFPKGACSPDSDQNVPATAGSALLELQFYPPGFYPLISHISCDAMHWCAALNIDSLAVTSNGQVNPNCAEPINFALIQKDGVPAGPPGPASATAATFTPNGQTLLMNQGDRIRVTIKDMPAGLLTTIEDLTTSWTGFMVASAANGFQNTDPDSCAPAGFGFHPEYDTAKFGNFVPWAVLQANINFSIEIGHFTPGLNGDGNSAEAPCFSGPTVPGCTGADTDFDGTSYRRDWADGTLAHPTSIAIGSVAGGGIGPLSIADDNSAYNQPFPIVQFETTVSASETPCQPNGAGCTVPPAGARFYPFYALAGDQGDDRFGGNTSSCTLRFGNFSGPDIDNFGGDAQYGSPNLYWFFGQNTSGPVANPCIPRPEK
jgi:hypothetical protein